ncbi:unnamed protein product, partial [Didymodactylos carnosus]
GDHLVNKTDKDGLVLGLLEGGATLAAKQASFLTNGLHYGWAVNRPYSESLALAKSLVEQGELKPSVDKKTYGQYNNGLEDIV